MVTEGIGTSDERTEERGAAGRSRLLRAAFSMATITLLSRVLGLVREQVRAFYLGTGGASDAFGVAFMLPNLLRRLVGEGAMSAAFVPVFNEFLAKDGKERTYLFANRFLSFLMLLLVVISAAGVLGAGVLVAVVAPGFTHEFPETRDLAVVLTAIMFPYIALVSLAAVIQGMLNSFKVFWVSAFTSVLLNLAIIGTALALAPRMEQAAYALAIGVMIGGVLQLFFQVPFIYKLGFRWRPTFNFGPGVRKAVWLMIPAVFGAGVYQINVLVSQALASGLPEGSISSLQYSTRLLELTLGVFAISVSTVILPTMSRQAARKDWTEMADTLAFAVRMVCFICVPAMCGLYLLRVPVIRLLFQRGAFDDTSVTMTAWALTFHLAGLVFIALSRIYVQAFYSRQDTRTPVAIATGAMVINIVACVLLRGPLENGGIALANTLSALFQVIFLVALLRSALPGVWKLGTWAAMGRSLVAAAAMSAAVWLIMGWLELDTRRDLMGLGLGLAAAVAGGVAVYGLLSWILRSQEVGEVLGMVKRRMGR